MKYVVDANVAIVASGRETHVGIDGQVKAAAFLQRVMKEGTVLEDSEDLAFAEYKRHLNFSGQPTMGDVFFQWLYQNRWGGLVVGRVPSPANGSILDVLPESLQSFDSDDHKWICIYLHGGASCIVNASDSDWADSAELLAAEGVRVLELLA